MTKIIKGDLILTKDTVFEESIEVQSNIICKSERFSLKVRGDINARNINARNIKAEDINALNINAWNINAEDINFYAVCFAYEKFICKSIKGRQENSKYFSLDGEVIIKSPQPSFLDRTDIPDILDEFYVDIESKVEDSTVKDLIKWLNAKVF